MKLYGRNPVLERIRTNPKSIRKIYLQQKKDLSEIVKEAKKNKLTFLSVDKNTMERLSANANTQGVLAEIDEFNYTPFEVILSDTIKGESIPVFLDSIQDPQNLGSIIRNLACLGGFSIVISKFDSCFVNETVLRVASGGENYIKISLVTNITTSLQKAKEKGLFIYGAEAEGEKDIKGISFDPPFAIVMGSEGKGIRPGIKKCLDDSVCLPMSGAPLSYNVSVATVLVCYEIKRRGKD